MGLAYQAAMAFSVALLVDGGLGLSNLLYDQAFRDPSPATWPPGVRALPS